MKSYDIKPGNCKDCALIVNCNNDKEETQRYLNSLGLECKEGNTVKVVDSE